MRKDHSGITFVELIIAIAISTIIFGAAILFLGMAHKNYNHASAQIDLQSESQILMEQIGMWVMEGNRVEKLDPSVSGVEGIVIYKIPGTPSITNPAGAAAPEAASKRVICRWKEITYKENGYGRSKNRYNGDFCRYG